MITVQVKKNQVIATKSKLEPMTSGSQNVYPVQFVFSAEWEYLAKVAVFATELGKDGPGNSVWNVLIDDNNRCFIPWEVNLVHSQHVYVGVYGTKNGNIILPTVWADLGNVLLGVTTGLDSEPPTPDIHDQILGNLAAVKQDVKDYKVTTTELVNKTKNDLNNVITKYQQDVTNYINQYQANTSASITRYKNETDATVMKFQNDTTDTVNQFKNDMNDMVTKYQQDVTNYVNQYQANTTALFNSTTKQIRDDALGQIGAIRNIVDDFTRSGLQIINGATIVNKRDIPDKVIPIDGNGDGVYDGTMAINKFPRCFILTNTTIASNAEDQSQSWSFANEVVHMREDIYVDETDNVFPAVYVTDMSGKTYAFLTDDGGNFYDMVPVLDPPIHYKDILDTPDLSEVTKMRCIAVTLRADMWAQTINAEPMALAETEDDEWEYDNTDQTLPVIITQTIRMYGISDTQRDQLVIPVPRDDFKISYYGSNIMLVGQELNTLYFQAFNGAPQEDIVVYIYIANATTYQWTAPPEPPEDNTDDDDCCCSNYEFRDGLTKEKPNEEGKIVVRVNAVDDFNDETIDLPMSARGVRDLVGNIERLLDNL